MQCKTFRTLAARAAKRASPCRPQLPHTDTSPGTTPTVRLVVSRVYQAERSWPLHTLMHAL